MSLRLAAFVTPHGFGHAARTCAILEALRDRGDVEPTIYSTVPRWFFEASLGAGSFRYQKLTTDVGLVQADPLTADLEATAEVLDRFLPFDPGLVESLGRELRREAIDLVLCDVAPLGIAVAEMADLRSVVVENFTWDWIYREYDHPDLERYAEILAPWFDRATLTVQATPPCRPRAEAVTVPPIARRPRRDREQTREALGVRSGEELKLVLVGMGGISWDYGDLSELAVPDSVVLVVPGAAVESGIERRGPAILMPHRTPLYHPDLVHAVDAVVAKLGYSTMAETWEAGLPFGYVPRPEFPEFPALSGFVDAEMEARSIPGRELRNGGWSRYLEELLAFPRRKRSGPRGADAAATAIAELL
ncbi:MAG: hypothetical protein R3234_07670 [Thermoanaerobaculia bacterium]|nr:hypothetical protein [Thermoanaerobaculia bacterium]